MAVEPSTFLLDEPTSQLDPASSAWLMELLNSFKDRTIISTTHNLSIVGELGDRVIVLSRDRDIIFDGPPAVLLSDRDLLIRSGLSHSHLHRHEQEIHTHYHVHDLD
jgi:cobalt/nickel transport system ATP-binding protein